MYVRQTRMRYLVALICLVGTLFAGAVSDAAGATTPSMHAQIFTRTGIRLTGILWTGRQFLYVENTTNRVYASGPSGAPLHVFAKMPREVEETRCVVSPGGHGFPTGQIYCNSPLNRIYRISPDGKSVTLFATIPHMPRSDGALAFDTSGHFGYALVAATGRSGNATARGGAVFTIDPRGKVQRVGAYSDPGGADELVIAPSSFGSAAGDALLAVDAGSQGSLVAMDAHGHTRTILRTSDGLNPLVVIPRARAAPTGEPRVGLYVTDTLSHDVFFAAASDFQSVRGDLVVGSEIHAWFWAVRPSGQGFTAEHISTNLHGKQYNLEAATYVAS